jgi:uncharacterized protein YjbI with pentapeptide repeats
MNQSELNTIIQAHALWIKGDANGARANLDGANLYRANLYRANLYRANLDGANLYRANLGGANLYGANLDGANLDGAYLTRANLGGAYLDGAYLDGAYLDRATGNNRHIKSLQAGKYEIAYTAKVMQVGCEQHDITDWWDFDDDTIKQMDRGALDWWRVWKPILMNIIEVSPAEPTGFVEKEAAA